MPPPRIVLASKSPQRKALMHALGLKFETVTPDVAEATAGNPQEVVLANAVAKARAVATRRREGTMVIAGDTEVVIDGSALGQPGFEGEARSCLELLSGRSHDVLGGLAILGPERIDGEFAVRTGVESTRVTFGDLNSKLIDTYLASGEWRGRAGGYAVQGLGSALVAGIDGDASNVIGLPIPLLLELAPELSSG